MAVADEVLIELQTRGAREAASDLNQIGTAGRNMGRGIESGAMTGQTAIAGMTKVMGPILAALGALQVAETALSFNNMKQQSELAFETMLGSGEAAKQMVQDIVQFAASTPFEVKGLTENTQKLLAFGFQAKDVLPMLQSIGDAMAGLGMGEEGINRAVRALGQMAARGKVTGDEMMQLTELGIPAWQALADAIGVDTGTAMKMVESGTVDAATGINAVLDLMDAKFGGLMEKQSHTLGGLASTIKDTFAQSIGAVAEPAVTRLTAAMEGLVQFTSTDQWSGFITGAQGMVEGVLSAFERLGSGEGFNGADIAQQVEGWQRALSEWVPGAMDELGTNLQNLIAGVGQWISDNGPWLEERFTEVWIPAAVAWVVETAAQIAGHLAEWIATVAKWVVDTGAPAMIKFGFDLGQGFLGGFVQGMGNVKDALGQWFENFRTQSHGMSDQQFKEWSKQFNLEQYREAGLVPPVPALPPPPEPGEGPAPVPMTTGSGPARLERGYIQTPTNLAGLSGKATKEQAEKVAETAITGFMSALAASKATMTEQFGQLGADSASALATAISQNTASSGTAVARSIEALITHAREAGIEDWRQLGDDLAGSFHDALVARTPEAQQAAMTMLAAVTSEVAGAKMATAINEATDKAMTAIGDAQTKAQDQVDKLVSAFDASDAVRAEMDRMQAELRDGLERMQGDQQRLTDQLTAGRSERDRTKDYGRQDLMTTEQRDQAQAEMDRSQQRRMSDLQRDYQRRVAEIQARGGPNAGQQLADAARAYQQQVADQATAAAQQRADLEERYRIEDQNRARQRQWVAEDAAQKAADVAADKERAASNQAALEAERARLQAPIEAFQLEQRRAGLAQQLADIRKNEADQTQRLNEQLAETIRLQEQLYQKQTGTAPGGDESGGGRETVEVQDVNMDGEAVGTITFAHQYDRIATAAGVSGGG